MSVEHPFDGLYNIETQSTALGFAEARSDGRTRIKESRTDRIDRAGYKWNSFFESVSDEVVRMVSRADPANADPQYDMSTPDGLADGKRKTQRFETLLDVTREEGRVIKMSGQIEANGMTVYISMTRLTD